MTVSDYLEPKILDAVLNNTSLVVASVYVKLHISDAGEAGTTGAAANTTRQSASFAAASGGSCASDAAVTWTNVPNAETYSHISLWDASTAGNCLWTGALSTPKAVNVGDDFTIPSGSLTVTMD